MPRARPGARKSTARRRIQRYRSKWTHHVLPVRIKELLPHMTEEYEETEPPFVECEEPTMAKLEELGVPTAEWPYYIGFMKRMLKLYLTYTGLTLLIERGNLLTEYVLRGYDIPVLWQIDEVAAGCAGVPYIAVITCDDVKACLTILTCEDVIGCLEGDFSTWTKIWDIALPNGIMGAWDLSITMSKDYVHILYSDSSDDYRFLVVKRADGSTVFCSPAGLEYVYARSYIGFNRGFHYNTFVDFHAGGGSFSILARYIVILRHDRTHLEVWKDGVLQWTSPLPSAVVSGATEWYTGMIRFDGKHILVFTDNDRLTCFEGS